MATDPTSTAIRRYSGDVASHTHAHHQFVLPLRGALEMDIGGRGGLVDDVRAALVRAEDAHAFLGHGETRCAILDVPADYSDALDRAADGARDPFFAIDPAMHHLLRYIEARGRIDSGVGNLLMATALDRIAGHPISGEPRQLRRALTFMEARSHRPLTAADVAEAAAVSERTLYSLFRRWVGKTPSARLMEIRMRRARSALSATDRSIADIAVATGFSDQAAFSRAFKRHTGQTPADYRRSTVR